MYIEDITINDLAEGPELFDQVTTSDKYLEAVSSLNQNMDFTGLGKALINVTENLPKIDTTGIATALQTVAAAGSALSNAIDFEKTASVLSTAARGLDICLSAGLSLECKTALSKAVSNTNIATTVLADAFEASRPTLPVFEGLNLIVQSEINFAQVMEEVVPTAVQVSETLSKFAERFNEIFAYIRERFDEIARHFATLMHEVAHRVLHGLSSIVVWIFKPAVPRAVLTYNLSERLKPPLFTVIVRRFLEYAPRIRRTYLFRGRERGNDSDDAIFGYLVTC